MEKPYQVSSEIFTETDLEQVKCDNGRIISKFKFIYPSDTVDIKIREDEDGDLIVPRRVEGAIELEHSESTVLNLVGLQVWRGALLLADFLFHNRAKFNKKNILELGAGVGLSSIAAGIHCKNVVCTDIDLGGILDLIMENIKRNKKILKNDIKVMELNFKKPFSDNLKKAIKNTDFVIAADVIYDDDLTDCFIQVLENIFDRNNGNKKIVYMALEKRYVFTISDLDTSAPCFDYFLQKASKKPWTLKYIPTDFPQYFQYERCKELVLLEISCNL